MWSGKSTQSQKQHKKKPQTTPPKNPHNPQWDFFFLGIFAAIVTEKLYRNNCCISKSNKALLLWYILSLLYLIPLQEKKEAKVYIFQFS